MLNWMVAWGRLHGVAALLVKTVAVSALLSLGAAACQSGASDAGCDSSTTSTTNTTGVGAGMNVTISCFAWDPSTNRLSSCPSTCPTRLQALQYFAPQACGIAQVLSDGTYDSSREQCCYEVVYGPCD